MTDILAATLTIAFEGLMLFHGPSEDKKTHAAIVNAPHHHPFVHVIGRNEVPLAKGDRITFSTGSGVGDTDDSFDDNVITLLNHVAVGNVDKQVTLNNVAHAGTLATVQLPDGDLSTFLTFPYRVKLDTWYTKASTHCFPRYVLLTVPITGTASIKIEHEGRPPDEYPIESGLVVISNGGMQGTTDTHFHEYRRLLGTFALMEKATLLKKTCDPVPPIPAGVDRDVIRILQDRVNRIPNGDCGPVDFP